MTEGGADVLSAGAFYSRNFRKLKPEKSGSALRGLNGNKSAEKQTAPPTPTAPPPPKGE